MSGCVNKPASSFKQGEAGNMDVVKLGGAEGIGIEAVCQDVAEHWRNGWRGVVVHGGSDATNQLGEALGRPPEFVTSVSGHTSRRCDRDTVEIFAQATALVNRRLVERLQGLGIDALGLSGLDGRTIQARRKAAIRVVQNGRQRVLRDEWTGRPTGCNADLLSSLIAMGHLPVIAPVAAGEEGEMLNIDGDRAAAVVAAELGAQSLIILSNVPGLMKRFPDEASVVAHIPTANLEQAATWAQGRMRKKVLGAQEALSAGVPRVVLADARRERPLTDACAGIGTVIGDGSLTTRSTER